MAIRLTRLASLIVCFSATIAPSNWWHGSTASQTQLPKPLKVISRDVYDAVLDIVFPRDSPDPSKTYSSIIMRFKPSFDVERQIVIRNTSGSYEVLEYEAIDGNIYGRLNHLINEGRSTKPEEMAKFLKVSKHTINLPRQQVENWHAAFLNSVARSLDKFRRSLEELEKEGTVTLPLDGTIYELWYEQGMNKIAFSVYDVELTKPEATGDLPLVRWMNMIRLEVERSVKKPSQNEK
jgi:hypothetical protein